MIDTDISFFAVNNIKNVQALPDFKFKTECRVLEKP